MQRNARYPNTTPQMWYGFWVKHIAERTVRTRPRRTGMENLLFLLCRTAWRVFWIMVNPKLISKLLVPHVTGAGKLHGHLPDSWDPDPKDDDFKDVEDPHLIPLQPSDLCVGRLELPTPAKINHQHFPDLFHGILQMDVTSIWQSTIFGEIICCTTPSRPWTFVGTFRMPTHTNRVT